MITYVYIATYVPNYLIRAGYVHVYDNMIITHMGLLHCPSLYLTPPPQVNCMDQTYSSLHSLV